MKEFTIEVGFIHHNIFSAEELKTPNTNQTSDIVAIVRHKVYADGSAGEMEILDYRFGCSLMSDAEIEQFLTETVNAYNWTEYLIIINYRDIKNSELIDQNLFEVGFSNESEAVERARWLNKAFAKEDKTQGIRTEYVVMIVNNKGTSDPTVRYIENIG